LERYDLRRFAMPREARAPHLARPFREAPIESVKCASEVALAHQG
jgi:hypothetical protein